MVCTVDISCQCDNLVYPVSQTKMDDVNKVIKINVQYFGGLLCFDETLILSIVDMFTSHHVVAHVPVTKHLSGTWENNSNVYSHSRKSEQRH